MSLLQRRIGVPIPLVILAAILIVILAVLALASDESGVTGSVFNATDPNAVVTAINAGRASPIAASSSLNNVAQQMADALVASGGSSAGDVNAMLNSSGGSYSAVGWGWTWNNWEIAAEQLAATFSDQGAANLTYNEIGIASATGNGATYYAAVWAAGSGGGGDTGGPQTAAITSARVDDMLTLVNNFRASYGLCALSINESLATAAIVHSEDMANNEFLGHQGSDGSWPSNRTGNTGYPGTFVGENALYRFDRDTGGAFQQWVDSQGHRDNMLNGGFDEVGIALAGPSAQSRTYYTMVLGSQGSGCN